MTEDLTGFFHGFGLQDASRANVALLVSAALIAEASNKF
jgi:hypothetical protein